MIEERHYFNELDNIVSNYPLDSVDVISCETVFVCSKRKWVSRNVNGKWVPTTVGLRVHAQYKAGR